MQRDIQVNIGTGALEYDTTATLPCEKFSGKTRLEGNVA